jgi:acyl dehydratase
MHVDPEAAKRGRFGGLIASGWHTGAMMMRLLADNFLPKRASLASPGIDELRWPRPVRPGDVLRIRVTVLDATRSRSKPDRGMVRTLIEVLNQEGDIVMSLKPMNIIACRSAS